MVSRSIRKPSSTRTATIERPMSRAREIWHSRDEAVWHGALGDYWRFVQPANVELEREFESLDAAQVRGLDAEGWYQFLLHKYFRWKYTARNRYGSTTKQLKRYANDGSLAELHRVKQDLFALDPVNVERGLLIATSIRGLGIAGASGLLSILLPRYFGTVDQFVVKALLQIDDLPEIDAVRRMNPEALKIKDGVLLIEIMRAKADENNCAFGGDFWTPRRIDMVMWDLGHETW